MLPVRHGHATHVGRVRRVNEDSALAEPPVFAVADGMGGHAAGDVASAVVVEELRALVGRPVDAQALSAALEAADRRVRDLSDESGRRLGAGSTVAAAALVDHDGTPSWLVVNCGDSRVYRFAGGRLTQLTVDHSLVQEMVDDGVLTPAEARRHPARNVVTRAVGASSPLEPDQWLLPVTPGERLVLCTDGLTNEVDDDRLGELAGDAAASPQSVAEALVEAAVDAGGHDNVTVVVVDVPEPAEHPPHAAPTPALH
ncbi:MAG: PP2C family protein-serine/threonine phosphatase [Actinomycetes bacterium]